MIIEGAGYGFGIAIFAELSKAAHVGEHHGNRAVGSGMRLEVGPLGLDSGDDSVYGGLG